MEIVVQHIPFEVLFAGSLVLLCIIPFVSVFFLRRLVTPKVPEPPSILTPQPVPDITTNPIPPKKPFYKILFLVSFTTIFLILLLFAFGTVITKNPAIIFSFPVPKTVLLSYAKPLIVVFDVPVNTQSLRIHSAPDLPGYWKMVRVVPFLPYARRFEFYPSESFVPDADIMVYFSNLNPIFPKGWGSELLWEFSSPKLPKVQSVTPKNEEIDVLATTDIIVQLSHDDGPQTVWDAELTPPAKYTIRRNNPKELRIDFDLPLSQNTKYQIKLFETPIQYSIETSQTTWRGSKQVIYDGSFSTVKSPLVTSFSPEGSQVLPNAEISIHFDDPMNAESVNSHLTITPPVTSLPVWDSEKKVLRWEGNSLTHETTYTVTLSAGTETQAHGTLENDFRYQFSTIGKVKVVDTTPKSDTKNIPRESPIIITFDQPVIQKSAESHFSLSPPIDGTLSWNGNSLMFQPKKNFAFGTVYSYSIKPGIESQFGSTGTDGYDVHFTTAPDQVVLPVQFIKQQEFFTCNIDAARMILTYRGVTVTEQELKDKVGFGGERGSGDPNKGYVTDYGTYWDPIQKAVNAYRPSHVYKDWTVTDILTAVAKGNPVLVWAQNGWSDPHEISWDTPQGNHIYAINGMHSYVVKGFRGSVNSPTAVITNDPWRGESVLSIDEFTRLWNFFKVAMVID
jgi:uncharacterized protein YvpB